MLDINQASLRMQSDPDYEQIIEVDDLGRGWDYALEMTKRAAEKVQGSYILVLDDDDILINAEAIRLWKEITANNPPAVIHKSWVGELGILPDEAHWRRQPELGFIGFNSFILRMDVLVDYIHKIQEGRYANDFDLIHAVYRYYDSQVVWLDQVMCWSLRRSLGRGEK
jgi:glycosyltransferase involved in cell wall biosynthesis